MFLDMSLENYEMDQITPKKHYWFHFDKKKVSEKFIIFDFLIHF